MTTLQKLVWKGATHTTVSAEAIRSAIRWAWQQSGQELNRRWDDNKRSHTWQDVEFKQGGVPYVDDDVLGFMSARAAREESNNAENVDAPSGRAGRRRGTTDVRRARLEVTRAVSLDPWPGDIVFNAAAAGATPTASSTGRDPVPYGAEVHATRYQYGFSLTPDSLYDRARAALVLDAIGALSDVAGNQARFLYDFAPSSIVLRWTDDPAPRFLYAFEPVGRGEASAPHLLAMVDAGDIRAEELWVGGEFATWPGGALLEAAGAHVQTSVKATLGAVRQALDV
jgi:CRISPR-associated protein Cst2